MNELNNSKILTDTTCLTGTSLHRLNKMVFKCLLVGIFSIFLLEALTGTYVFL